MRRIKSKKVNQTKNQNKTEKEEKISDHQKEDSQNIDNQEEEVIPKDSENENQEVENQSNEEQEIGESISNAPETQPSDDSNNLKCSGCSLYKPSTEYTQFQLTCPHHKRKCNTCSPPAIKYQCASCKNLKLGPEFARKQLSLAVDGKGICRVCIKKKEVQKQFKNSLIEHGINDPDAKLKCKLCHQDRPKFEYTVSNLKRKENRVCMYCLSGNVSDQPEVKIQEEKKVSYPDVLDSEQQINQWNTELEETGNKIKELENTLDTELVGAEHKNRRKTARDNLSKLKIEITSLKDKIEAEKAYVYLRKVLKDHRNVTESEKKNV